MMLNTTCWYESRVCTICFSNVMKPMYTTDKVFHSKEGMKEAEKYIVDRMGKTTNHFMERVMERTAEWDTVEQQIRCLWTHFCHAVHYWLVFLDAQKETFCVVGDTVTFVVSLTWTFITFYPTDKSRQYRFLVKNKKLSEKEIEEFVKARQVPNTWWVLHYNNNNKDVLKEWVRDTWIPDRMRHTEEVLHQRASVFWWGDENMGE